MSAKLCQLLLLLTPLAAEPAVVAHWTMDGDGPLLVDSGPHHLDARPGGTPLPERRAGVKGPALFLAAGAGAFAEAPRHPAVNLTPPFTVAAWVKPAEAPGAHEVVSCRGDTDPGGWRLRLGWGMGTFHYHDGTNLVEVSVPPRTIPNGYWVHLAATHDGRQLRLYANAEEIASREAVTAPAPANRALVIGNYIGRKDAYPFVGGIDDVYLAAAALDGEQIFRLAAGL